MAVSVMIKRKVKPGEQARKLIPMILQLRALATYQPGYISGETLRNVSHPEECLVISTWESLQDWEKWHHSKQRTTINNRIESLTGESTDYNIYEPMVGRTFQETAPQKE
jgi:heme-degrading monooxygenase HmoA